MKSAEELRRELAVAEKREAQWRERYGPAPEEPGSTVTVTSLGGSLGYLWVLETSGVWKEMSYVPSYTWPDICSVLDELGRGRHVVVISTPRKRIYT